MFHINLKNSTEAEQFLNKFSDDKRGKVAQYLVILGIDMAKKLGQPMGSPELFKTLQQLAKNIESKREESGGLKNEIRKIQEQLQQLNERFNRHKEDDNLFSAEQNYWNNKQRQFTFSPPKFVRDDNDFQSSTRIQNHPINQLRDQQFKQTPHHHDSNYYYPSSSFRTNRMLSPKSRDAHSYDVTAKITESPPPPIVYIQNVNAQVNVRRHLDDRQIKSLLYDQESQQKSQKGKQQIKQKYHPKTIHYTIPSNGQSPVFQSTQFDPRQSPYESNRQQPYDSHGRPSHSSDLHAQNTSPFRQEEIKQVPHHLQPHSGQNFSKKQKQQSLSQSNKNHKLPSYLQNVQSKIRDQIIQDKMAYYQNAHNYDQEGDEEQIDYEEYQEQDQDQDYQQQYQQNDKEEFDNDNIQYRNEQTAQFQKQNMPNNNKNDNFYDIQQYLIEQRNTKQQFSFSPVQEMNAIQDNNQGFQESSNGKEQRKLVYQPVTDFQYQPRTIPTGQSSYNYNKRTSEQQSPMVFSSAHSSKLKTHSRTFQNDTEKASERRKVANLRPEEEDSSDTFSNFTPPNKEVREFFQRQYAQNMEI